MLLRSFSTERSRPGDPAGPDHDHRLLFLSASYTDFLSERESFKRLLLFLLLLLCCHCGITQDSLVRAAILSRLLVFYF